MLKEVAEKRLAAIREYSDLGSGFKIAMRDLEIRGSGNLLGAEQSLFGAFGSWQGYFRVRDGATLQFGCRGRGRALGGL